MPILGAFIQNNTSDHATLIVSYSCGIDAPQGPRSGSERVIRGGSWLNESADVRVADRNKSVPGYRAYDIGFRLVSSPQ